MVPDMSGSVSSPSVSGPETPFVVGAVAHLLDGDLVRARMALLRGADAVGWHAIALRLDVAGHALLVDAGLWDPPDAAGDGSARRGDIVLLPGLDTSTWSVDEAADVLERWTTGTTAPAPLNRIWTSLGVVAWLIDRAGYPPEVVA